VERQAGLIPGISLAKIAKIAKKSVPSRNRSDLGGLGDLGESLSGLPPPLTPKFVTKGPFLP
jgi:hypothetical protein